MFLAWGSTTLNQEVRRGSVERFTRVAVTAKAERERIAQTTHAGPHRRLFSSDRELERGGHVLKHYAG
jgi:hypothetical protein